VHDRLRRSWRHLDFFQFEAWLHADVPRVACGGCGKTTQLSVPWARPGSGFTAAFEALALALCRELPVRQAAALLRCKRQAAVAAHRVLRRSGARLESFAGVQIVGIDETSLRRGQHYITVVHDLDAKRLLFATEGRDHQTVLDFAADLKAHGGDPAEVRHVCMDMSAAYAKGAALALPAAAISYDRFHVIAMAIQAMDDVRREELRTEPEEVAAALLGADPRTRRHLLWGMRKNPSGWSMAQTSAMHWLQRSALKSARAWRLRMALREVYARARQHNSAEQAAGDLAAWTSWAGAAAWSRSRSWPRRSRSASTPSCAACSITAATPSSSR
jgi:transposase